MSSRFFIDGREIRGGSISIINGVVTIDGVRQTDTVSGVVEIRVVEGVLGKVECDAPLTCGDVHGDVRCNGPMTCGDIGGNATAHGPMTCGDIGGNATAYGPMSRR